MDEASLKQVYDNDPRPTFIVDCNNTSIYHANKALLALPHLASSLDCPDGFRDWWDPNRKPPDNSTSVTSKEEFDYAAFRWVKFAVPKHWRVVAAMSPKLPSDRQHDDISAAMDGLELSRVRSCPTAPETESIFNAKIQSPELRKHIEYIRRVDWAATSLGPISSWTKDLHQLVTLMMLETRPTALFLGPDNTVIYNVAYAGVSGNRHPGMFGRNVTELWPEIAPTINAVVDRARNSSFADAPEEEFHHMIMRNGYIEETYFSWSVVPLAGAIDGLYSIVTETTKQRLLERRVSALLHLGELTGAAIHFEAFWSAILRAMLPYEYDFPVAILYSITEPDTTNSAGSGRSFSRHCVLEGFIGYSGNHEALQKSVDLDYDDGIARALSDTAKNGIATLFRREDGTLPESLFTETERRGFGDQCKEFIICPVQPASKESVSGFLIIGLNTRRPYDTEYQEWIQMFSKLLGASAASVAMHEDEIRSRKRAAEQAARDRAVLQGELAVVTEEVNTVQTRLRTFHDVANKVGVGYFEYDINRKLKHANDAFFRQTGQPLDSIEIAGFHFADRVYPEDLDMVMGKWETLAAGHSVSFDMRWKREPTTDTRNNSEGDRHDYLWILSACVPIKNKLGDVIGISGCNTDVSAQKESTRVAQLKADALERARASEERLANYTQISPVAVCHLNADLEMQYCNSKWFEITGHPIVPFDKIEWPPIIHEEDLDQVYKDVEIAMHQKEPHTFFFRTNIPWAAPDGSRLPTCLLATAMTELNDDGSVSAFLATMTDVTQMRWAEDMQKIRVQEVLESKRQQENFIDMTSHEMRNPLSAMVQCTDSISSSLNDMSGLAHGKSLSQDFQTQTQLKDLIIGCQDALETIQACATHQKRIVDDILTLSKLDSKLLIISPIVARPSVLLQDTYKMFKDEASKAGVALGVCTEQSYRDYSLDWAVLDPSRVLQILINLITNAIKFTKDQKIRKVEISMGVSSFPEKRQPFEYVPQESARNGFLNEHDWESNEVIYIHFTVRDTGCGLTPEHKAKLFMRFSQATPKTHVQYGGSGLGLFISRELTEMQGGSIGVQSNPGGGSTFTFHIKSRRASPPPRSSFDMASTSNGDIAKSISRSPPTELHFHILVVEDNVINQRVLCNQLMKLGCTVQAAGHGGEAIEQLQKTTYWKTPLVDSPFNLSVVLMDVEMPIMDGLTCTKRIRALEASGDIVGHVPIIAVSANARREQIEQAKQVGMDDAICKPFHIPELLPKIERLVHQR